MFPLPFSISPLLLSIFVLYPWALALGVWQVGKLTSRQSNSSSSLVGGVGQRLDDGGLAVSRLESSLSDRAASPLPAIRLIDLPDVIVVSQSFLPFHGAPYASPSIAHRIPRAPPAVA